MPSEPLDFLSLIIALLTFVASKEVAYVVGPSAAIVLLACAGSALALSAEEQTRTVGAAAVFVGIRVILAVTVTIFLAELVQLAFPALKPRYTLSPIAFGIGWIRDYNAVRTWVGELITRLFNKRVDDGK